MKINGNFDFLNEMDDLFSYIWMCGANNTANDDIIYDKFFDIIEKYTIEENEEI